MKSRFVIPVVILLLVGFLSGGCASTSSKMLNLKLGMTPEEVLNTVGEPFTVRAAKQYEEGTTEVWEYLPRAFTVNPRSYWVYFEKGKVVQWGEPGDFAPMATPGSVTEYLNTKVGR